MPRFVVVALAVLAVVFGLVPMAPSARAATGGQVTTAHPDVQGAPSHHRHVAGAAMTGMADCHHQGAQATTEAAGHAAKAPCPDKDGCGRHGFGGCMDMAGCRHLGCTAMAPLPTPPRLPVVARPDRPVARYDVAADGLTVAPLLDPPRSRA